MNARQKKQENLLLLAELNKLVCSESIINIIIINRTMIIIIITNPQLAHNQ